MTHSHAITSSVDTLPTLAVRIVSHGVAFRIPYFALLGLSMIPLLEQKLARYRELEEQLYDPAPLPIPPNLPPLPRSAGRSPNSLNPTSNCFNSIAPSRTPSPLPAGDEPEMRTMAEEELASLRPKRATLYSKIEEQLLIDPLEDFTKLIVEIRPERAAMRPRFLRATFTKCTHAMHAKRMDGWKRFLIAPAKRAGSRK